jgi:hypothetical protein
MVPQPGSTLRRRVGALGTRGWVGRQPFVPAHSTTTRKAQPITYGKRSKPLSLTGKQFRPSTYDTPSDDDEPTQSAGDLLQAAGDEGKF